MYWTLSARWRSWGLIASTMVCLLAYSPESAVLLSVFTIGSYYLSRPGALLGPRVLGAAVMVIGVLVYFKLVMRHERADTLVETVLPIGLSYYSFRCVHYLIERYRGTVPEHNFSQCLAYLFFLPTIVVGPIHRVRPFLQDLDRRKWDGQRLSEGLERLLYGYVKITVLGNFIVAGRLQDMIATIDPSHDVAVLYLRVVRDGLNLYLQFSGFSDVAIGFSLLLGYRVIENFNWPYLQRNLPDFWRSWHISLTSWCREYVYMPTLGATRNPYLSVLLTFVTIGLWHDISLGYLAWGVYNGLGVLACLQWQRVRRRIGLRGIKNRFAGGIVHGLSVLLTTHYFWLGSILVREPDLQSAWTVYAKILLGWL